MAIAAPHLPEPADRGRHAAPEEPRRFWQRIEFLPMDPATWRDLT